MPQTINNGSVASTAKPKSPSFNDFMPLPYSTTYLQKSNIKYLGFIAFNKRSKTTIIT